MSENEMKHLLERIYFDEKHPASFGGVRNLYRAAKSLNSNITLKFVHDWLSSRFEYSLFKPTVKIFSRNKTLATYINEYWQCDTLDYSNISRFNNGFKYLICVIDVFSKYLMVIPLKSKTMTEVTYKFNILFNQIKPTHLQSDRGTDFYNREFKNTWYIMGRTSIFMLSLI